MTEDLDLTRDFDDELAKEVYEDFLKRQQERRFSERGWQLNMNFVCGNQYCDINSSGEIYELDQKYFWQSRRVFNHIAAIVDIRCAKLSRVRPKLTVRAASEEEGDRHSASLATSILSALFEDGDIDGVLTDGTVWAETCGTAFYKIVWDDTTGGSVGAVDGKSVKVGGVKISALSPFEIYPYSLSEENLEAQPSIIHARAVSVKDIYTAYGVKLAGRDIEEFSLSPYSAAIHSRSGVGSLKSVRHDYEILVERYERPTAERPLGRLTIVAGGKLLFDGDMPYINGDDGARVYPFVRQTSVRLAGSFFGTSVVDRLIPLQRAYNAVKNRKHEFLNRISMGCVAVEDGSVNCEELEEDGLVPGKILVYRQGGKPPEALQLGSVPSEFSEEEANLIQEFAKVSGTNDLSENADSFAGVTSATGLQLILDQDEIRMENAYAQIKRALKNIGRQALRLYRQFATDMHLLRYAGENNALTVIYFKGSDISSDDVVLEADAEANLTSAQKRSIIYELMDRGLFLDDEGKFTASAKNKIFEMLGYKSLAGERDLSELNRARASEENVTMEKTECPVNEYDDHVIHITEHKAYLLTGNISKDTEGRICAHIKMHESAKDGSKEKKMNKNVSADNRDKNIDKEAGYGQS